MLNFADFENPENDHFYKNGSGGHTVWPKIKPFGIFSCYGVGVRLGIVGGLGPRITIPSRGWVSLSIPLKLKQVQNYF